ncbi:phosphatidylinositol phospholipase C SCDLUD_000962 [Saccharomycodes ludwigii]|uniref:phosphatidylinositol phospholipase C n=1 Tax=Saccharomycodes ludwigii TaxID=36035 RepID=UPI001E8598E9|nr:hypothetical protein SCDLUD_000962 [Saccharomycodes ludwigii]KAH3903336.1 hypothetical protein SCDLUD_000962 [Saccharomycodes ludwigii]
MNENKKTNQLRPTLNSTKSNYDKVFSYGDANNEDDQLECMSANTSSQSSFKDSFKEILRFTKNVVTSSSSVIITPPLLSPTDSPSKQKNVLNKTDLSAPLFFPHGCEERHISTTNYIKETIIDSKNPLLQDTDFNNNNNNNNNIAQFQNSDLNTNKKIKGYLEHMKSKGVTFIKVTRKKRTSYNFMLIKGKIIRWKDKYLDIDGIKDIRIGDDANNYKNQFNINERYWITIIYQVPKNKLKGLHVYTNSVENFTIFYDSLCYIVKTRHELMKQLSIPDNEEFAIAHWGCRKTNDGLITFDDLVSMCLKYNLFCSSSFLRKIFIQVDTTEEGCLNYEGFKQFVKILKTRREMKDLFHKLVNKPYMDFEEFINFVVNVQKETWPNTSQDKLRGQFEKYSKKMLGVLTEKELLKYLLDQPPLHPSKDNYNYPLNNYFISSSHNTYLRGNQFGATCTIEGYIEVLQRGCRCVEVDVWDGSDNMPVVCHGILTDSLSLRSVLEVIRKYAFITTPYPLIVSFETHCKDTCQLVMAELITELLGDCLYVDKDKKSTMNILPSPNQLKNKILIKVTKTLETNSSSSNSSTNNNNNNNNNNNRTYNTDAALNSGISGMSSASGSMYDSEYDLSPEVSYSCSNATNASTKVNNPLRIKKKRIPLIQELLDLAAINGLRFRNFSLQESKTTKHSFSLSEKKYKSLIKDSSQKLAIDKHNRRYLMRTYPHAFRCRSTNFNPILFWRLGVQMVATNWQTNDLGQWLNIAMFQAPMGEKSYWNSGYVLKPRYLLKNVKAKELNNFYRDWNFKILELNLDVLSAQLLPIPESIKEIGEILNLAVHVEVFTAPPVDTCAVKSISSLQVENGFVLGEMSGKTKYIKDNGFNPVWNSKFCMKFYNTELNFIRFLIKSNDNVIVATCCMKITDMKKGYRHIPLFNNETGERFIFSTLFIKIDY